MKEVTIRLSDLRLLVEQLFDAEATQRAETSVLTSLQEPYAAGFREFAFRVAEALPAAKKDSELRYRQLRESLASGDDVSAALARFLNTN